MVLSVYTGLFSRCYALASANKLTIDYKGDTLTIIWPVQKEPESLACNIAFYDVFDRSSFPGVSVNPIDQMVREETDLKKLISSFDVKGICKELQSRKDTARMDREIAGIMQDSVVINFHPPKGMLWWDSQYLVYSQKQNERVIKECEAGNIDKLFIHVNSSIIKDYESLDLSCLIFNKECVNRARKIMGDRTGVIGLHLRRTDHGTAITQSPTDVFLKKIDEEIQKDDSVRFFLATDSVSEQDNLIDRYGDRIITQDNKAWGRFSKEEMWSGIVDVLCLSMCDRIYGSCGSVFSRFAAEYGRKELIIVKNEE